MKTSWFALLAAVSILSGCRQESANPTGADASATIAASAPATVTAAPSVLVEDAGAPPDDAGSPRTELPVVAPTLDDAKGRRALAAYRALLAKRCGASPPESLPGIGLPGADASTLCLDPKSAGKAFASGSFEVPAADEVLLEVPSGLDGAAGDRALALMRGEGTGYRLVKHMIAGKGFAAKIRLTTPSGRDALLLCQHHGNMGLHPSTCGFWGEGSFRAQGQRQRLDTAVKDELGLVTVTTCGPGASVEMGPITLRDDVLQVELVVERFEMQRGSEDEGDFCSKKASKGRKQHRVEYRFDAGRFRRITPTTKEVDEVLKRY